MGRPCVDVRTDRVCVSACVTSLSDMKVMMFKQINQNKDRESERGVRVEFNGILS